MTAGVETGRDNNAQGAPYASVSYGPLLFALPIPDTSGPNTPDPATRWNYALDVQTPSITIERSAMPASGNAVHDAGGRIPLVFPVRMPHSR